MANCVELPIGVRVMSVNKVGSYFALKDIAAHASKVAGSCEKDEWGCSLRVEGYAVFSGYLCVIVARSADEASRCKTCLRDYVVEYEVSHPDIMFTLVRVEQ